MKNVVFELQGNKLIITVDLAKEFGLSKSQKTILIASTAGNVTPEGTKVKVGLNVYKSRE